MNLPRRVADALGVPHADLLAEPNPIEEAKLRPGERTLLAMTCRLYDAALADLVCAVRLMAKVARRSSGK